MKLNPDGAFFLGAEIAAERGGSAEALRKQLARALDRVAAELGLDEFRRG